MKRMWQSSKVFAILVASVASGAVSLLAGGIAAGAQPSVETPPVLSAKQFLPPQLLAGPRFRVDEQVPTSDLVARFTLRSDFGAFEAHGVEMLRVRVAELAAIEQLEATSK
ncbi:MAG TPA: hypothetical protein VLM91_12985, partial [Candidatus Methylomirabilis sp.]|nr:hypothetical protein [Candidatus Methylomirabilis sp.]